MLPISNVAIPNVQFPLPSPLQALRATTNPGAAKDRRCRSGWDLPPPGLRLRLAGVGSSPPPIRASSPRRDTKRRLRGARNLTKSASTPIRTFPYSFREAPKRAFTVNAELAMIFFSEAREAGVFVCGEGRFSCPAAWRNPKGADGGLAPADEVEAGREADGNKSPTGDSPCRRVRGRA